MRENWLVQAVSRVVGSAATELGYRAIPTVGDLYHRPRRAWYLLKAGTKFETAALCFALYRPRRFELWVDFLGSPLALDRLVAAGFVGTSARVPLQYYLTYLSETDEPALLPPEIEFVSEESAKNTLAALRSAIDSVHPAVWDVIWENWRAAQTHR